MYKNKNLGVIFIKSVNLNYDKYYINQGDTNFKDIKFKNGTTIKSYGCFVCAIAMKLCKRTNSRSISDKKRAIKSVISQATNSDGNVTGNSVTFNGYTLKQSKTQDMASQLLEGHACIAQVLGHFVLVVGYDKDKNDYEAYKVKDSGNRKFTTLQDVINKYGNLKSKRKLR